MWANKKDHNFKAAEECEQETSGRTAASVDA